ncbi:adenylate/guanylate cyclase domain-containing protein [Hoeflea prorocentri]|uniref:Adenylate/guanylate cyclase domain-containing protein n=1 Tax=Hoeflea prorocentri TaxID=1922333 RepID=A0A9X3ZG55_9HYPH|nr:adenylate/guanylate cyclase domain-containing protein [Hoeflea prorocentri]MCY6379456.1 adenylate/guanylate cyclase domain-containing protein [Hoeflea prorocentri]MDA5397256.1 adenylate/guanylate cyclase domain-containing protein [Hoeflea prorocentri]
MSASFDELVVGLCEALCAEGVPLWRLRLAFRTLHPLVTATSSVWEREGAETERIDTPHGMEGRSDYAGSPMEFIASNRSTYRRRLREPLTQDDHHVLHGLRERGGTDYFGMPLEFSDEMRAIIVFVTDAEGGFSDGDIEGFIALAPALAPIVEVFRGRLLSLAVTEAYLGRRTGKRVLDGKITRGDVETINAAILFSDIRGWTGISSRLPANEALALANSYFELVGEAVEAHGGEILKFMGDGVLAVFSADDMPSGRSECRSALDAAFEALRQAEQANIPDLEFGIGLHFGEVLYGNIGSRTRIDFTVLGSAVNVAARIESLCGPLATPVLFSEAFAERARVSHRLVSTERLKGIDGPMAVYTATVD